MAAVSRMSEMVKEAVSAALELPESQACGGDGDGESLEGFRKAAGGSRD